MNKAWIALALIAVLALGGCKTLEGYRNVHVHCERGEDGEWSCEVDAHNEDGHTVELH